MRLEDKKAAVEKWQEIFGKAGVVILADYSGLDANEMSNLRRDCHTAGVDFEVVKNTLAKRAIVGSPYEFLSENFRGPIAVATGIEDQVAPAKVLAGIAKKNKNLELIFGGLDGNPLDPAGIEMLSKMPGRDELRAQFLGLLNNVPGGFVRLLNAVPSGLVNVLDARKRNLEEAA